MPLQDIETIVYVMLENRSFDHMLGYLSMVTPPDAQPVDGLRSDPEWLRAVSNRHGALVFPPHRLAPGVQQIIDPPHDHAAIAIQIGAARPDDPGSLMRGFVDSYMTRQPPPPDPAEVMGYYDAASVPVYDFFARNYAVCDHWFAALPCGTQPNRLMAMSGHSPIIDNTRLFLPDQPLVYDWLTAHGVSWCAYQSGDFLPFFALMPRLLPEIATSLTLSALGGRGRFRRYDRFRQHWLSDAPMPSVMFFEPEYTDGPHLRPNDDHPPSGIAKGQAFIAEVYQTLIANPDRWRSTALIVTYDEHGGFFDHVPPLPIPANLGAAMVQTTGIRVPAFVVSPHVAPGVPVHANFDHTSFLQLLADKYDADRVYSTEVTTRQAQLGRLSEIFAHTPDDTAALPSLPATMLADLAHAVAAGPPSSGIADSTGAAATAIAFRNLARSLAKDHPDLLSGAGWESLLAQNEATQNEAL